MDGRYPHWYHDMGHMGPMEECCDYEEKEVPCDYPMMPIPKVPTMIQYKESFKDRLACLLGDEVVFAVCGPIGICRGRGAHCGTLCFIGCDFVIINVCYHRRAFSLHIPICMLTFIAPR